MITKRISIPITITLDDIKSFIDHLKKDKKTEDLKKIIKFINEDDAVPSQKTFQMIDTLLKDFLWQVFSETNLSTLRYRLDDIVEIINSKAKFHYEKSTIKDYMETKNLKASNFDVDRKDSFYPGGVIVKTHGRHIEFLIEQWFPDAVN